MTQSRTSICCGISKNLCLSKKLLKIVMLVVKICNFFDLYEQMCPFSFIKIITNLMLAFWVLEYFFDNSKKKVNFQSHIRKIASHKAPYNKGHMYFVCGIIWCFTTFFCFGLWHTVHFLASFSSSEEVVHTYSWHL